VSNDSIFDEVQVDDGFAVARMTKPDDPATGSWSRTVNASAAGSSVVDIGVWKADAGSFTHAGGAGETFIVIDGRGTFALEGGESGEIGPGSMVSIPPKTPWTLVASEPIRKFYVVHRPTES